ncbi:MAG: 5'-methylthioadenosine phosphorylase [Gemmatimonadota bacterium]
MSVDASVGVILGSAFSSSSWGHEALTPCDVETPWGEFRLWRSDVGGLGGPSGRPAYVSFRHGRPHSRLPHQIPYRAQAWAFREVGCAALLVTSSVGVLDGDIPLGRPILLDDLLMLDNRLPDGTACTMFVPPVIDAGHLILSDGLFSMVLTRQVERLVADSAHELAGRAVFGYAPGPRGKSRAENLAWSRLGAQVNSMTVAPEVVLANELEIPCAGLVVGHKYSTAEPTPGGDWGREADRTTPGVVDASLRDTRGPLTNLAAAFLRLAEPVPFTNQLYRFDVDRADDG